MRRGYHSPIFPIFPIFPILSVVPIFPILPIVPIVPIVPILPILPNLSHPKLPLSLCTFRKFYYLCLLLYMYARTIN